MIRKRRKNEGTERIYKIRRQQTRTVLHVWLVCGNLMGDCNVCFAELWRRSTTDCYARICSIWLEGIKQDTASYVLMDELAGVGIIFSYKIYFVIYCWHIFGAHTDRECIGQTHFG